MEKSKLRIIDSNTSHEEKLTTNLSTNSTTKQRNKDVEDQIIEGKYFVIATGAKPRPLGIEGEEKYVTPSDQFLELDQIPKEIVFIGGGYISFELAHIAAHAGCKATILHRSNKVLYPHFDPDLVKELIKKSRELGIDILLGNEVTKVSKKEDTSNKLIVYSKSSADFDVGVENRLSSIETDMVVHGAGRIPNIDNLNLSAADKDFDISRYHDEYVEELKELIKAKAKGEVQVLRQAVKRPRQTQDLIAVLKASLEKPSPAKATKRRD